MMRCENCGSDLPEQTAYCPECGERAPLPGASRSAEDMIDLAHTGGLVRGWGDVQVPEPPEIPSAPDEAPDIPERAPLPDAAGMEIPGGEASSVDIGTGFLDKARLREDQRRAAQALVETAQSDLREELKEIAERESLIEQRGYDLADVYPQEEQPPPPPPAEERMWEETRERAEQHGVREFVGDTTPESDEKTQQQVEESGQNCCSYGCVAFFVVLFLLFLIGFILNTVQ